MITLPWPPTVNTLHTVSKGRKILSARGRAWYEEAGWLLARAASSLVRGRVEIAIKLYPPTRRRYDIDNRIKPVLDLLTKHQIIEDDDITVVRRLTVTGHDYSQDEPARAEVEVRPYEIL